MEPLDKNTIRVKCLGMRKQISLETAHAAAKALTPHLLSQIPPMAKIIAGYHAIHNEIDVRPTLEMLYARGHMLCLPVVVGAGKPLIFRRWQPGDALEKGAYGVDAPAMSKPELFPDAVIVPLAAFDARGHRLGYGAGYYDRTISQLRERKQSVRIIGAAYALQQVEQIPEDEFDCRLDVVVTEKGIIKPA